MCRRALFLIALCACLPAWADTPPELGEVVVTATRVDTGALESPSAITVITPEQVATSGAQDAAGLINGTAGVVVNDGGPTGALQTVSLRGSTSAQVLVLVDGMRQNASTLGTFDLSTIPLTSIDHIEIVRGAESALYGSSAIGGVINIITKKAAKSELSLSVTNGSYIPHDATEVTSTYPSTVGSSVAANPWDLLDTQSVDLSVAGALGEVGLRGGGTFTRAANGYTWNDTTYTNAWRRLPNSDSLSGNGYAGVTAPLLGGEVAAKGALVLSNMGTPGSLTTVSASARQSETQATGSAAWKTESFFSDALTLDLKSFYRYDEIDYNDPSYPPASVARMQTAGMDITQRLAVNDVFSAVYGGSIYYDYVDSTSYAVPHDRLNAAGFLSVPVSPSDTFTFTPTARYDFFSDSRGNFSYSLDGVYRISDNSSLRASFGSAYRVPTLNDLYWYDPSGYTASNPDLKPETSYNGEMDASLVLQKVSMDASVFTRYVVNNIIWLTNPSTFVWMPLNLNETLFPGAEIHAKAEIIDGLSVEASYTFVYSFLLNDGTTAYTLADDKRVPYAPMHTLGASIRYTGKVQSAGIELRYLSDQDTTTTILPGYVVVDADYRLATSQQVALTLAAKNIFNALYYTQLGYPMPPFSLEAGLKLQL